MQPAGRFDTEDSALALVQKWCDEARNAVEILPATSRKDCEEALLWLELSARTPLGAIALQTGGILVHHGWLRILGGGHRARLPRSVAAFNRQCAGVLTGQPPDAGVPLGCILVADDVVGGFFALNGGRLSEDRGTIARVFYLAPDTLEWECTGMRYSEFVRWACEGDLAEFYALYPIEPPVECPDLEEEEGAGPEEGWWGDVGRLRGDQAFHFAPPLWDDEGGAVVDRERSAGPVVELFQLMASLAQGT